MGTKGYENGFRLTLMPDRLEQPLHRKIPTTYLVNSMSDLFHEKIPFDYLDRIMEVIKKTPQHKYQILTKRQKRMFEYCQNKKLPKNIWLGVTVENIKQGLPRIEVLKEIDAEIRFLSIEPLLEDLGKVNFQGIHWAIVGGESGAKARPMKKEWVLNIKEQCNKQKIAFFFKQWGTWGEDNKKRSKKANGCLLNGKIWRDYPIKKQCTN